MRKPSVQFSMDVNKHWGSPERVAHLVQKFLRQFRPKECWSLTYATICSKPRVGEFGGGAVFVTADTKVWKNAYDFVEAQREAFRKRQQIRDQTSQLVKRAGQCGLRPDDLDDLVHDAASQDASAVDNDGLESQIEYLIEQWGFEETQKALEHLKKEKTNDGETPQAQQP